MRASSFVLGLLSGAATLIPVAANAAAATPAATSVEELVVTAQRRTERFVDAPVSVSVVTASQLADSGVAGTRDLRLVTPGLNISFFGPYVQPSVRGVGTTVVGPGTDSNVAIYVDGVYQASQTAALFDFNNIDRIETLKGPQGSLYGRNATGGAIVVTTRAPSLTERSGSAEVSYGRFHEFDGSGYVNLPVTDKLAVNLAVYNHANDGYTTNVFNNMKTSVTTSFGARARILFQANDGLRFILTGTHIYQKDNTAFSILPFQGNTPAPNSIAARLGQTDHSKIALNVTPSGKVDQTAFSLNTEWSGDWGTLTSISSYNYSDSPFVGDQDGTELPILSSRIPLNREKTLTQEFTFASPQYEKFSWVGGFYFLRDEAKTEYFVCAGAFCPTAFYPLTPSVMQNTTAWAAYAEGTYNITDRLHATLGGRYSWEEKHAQYRNGHGGFLMLNATNAWDSFTPKASLRYDLTKVSSAYVSYSEGFKSGLFDILNTTTCASPAPSATCPSSGFAVSPETVKAYEAGYKYNAGGLSISTAAYYNDYSNIQMVGRDAIGNTILYNAAAAKVYGLEAEFSDVLNENWSVHGGATYTHARYSNFPAAQDWRPLPTGGNATYFVNAKDHHMIRTPEYTVFGSVNYHRPISVGSVDGSLTASHSGSYYWDPSNRLQQPAYTIVNGRLSWTSPSERFRVSVFGDNLTDEETMMYVRSSNTGDLVSYSKPRTWGVSLGVNF